MGSCLTNENVATNMILPSCEDILLLLLLFFFKDFYIATLDTNCWLFSFHASKNMLLTIFKKLFSLSSFSFPPSLYPLIARIHDYFSSVFSSQTTEVIRKSVI